jgi:hypothetical protein
MKKQHSIQQIKLNYQIYLKQHSAQNIYPFFFHTGQPLTLLSRALRQNGVQTHSGIAACEITAHPAKSVFSQRAQHIVGLIPSPFQILADHE